MCVFKAMMKGGLLIRETATGQPPVQSDKALIAARWEREAGRVNYGNNS